MVSLLASAVAWVVSDCIVNVTAIAADQENVAVTTNVLHASAKSVIQIPSVRMERFVVDIVRHT